MSSVQKTPDEIIHDVTVKYQRKIIEQASILADYLADKSGNVLYTGGVSNAKSELSEQDEETFPEERLYPDNKVNIDPEYLHTVKKKLESLLLVLIERYNLKDFISVRDRFRLDLNKMSTSKYHDLYEQKKDIDGNQLRLGYEYIPTDFEEWLSINLQDYTEAAGIYTLMCQDKRIMKDDLISLNNIAKRYKVK